MTHFQSKSSTNLPQTKFWRQKQNDDRNKNFDKNAMSDADVGRGNKFCAPDQIGKTKRSGSGGIGSYKIFQNSFESLGFIHILISCLKNQQLNQTI